MADGTEVGSLYYDFDADDSKLQSKLSGTDAKVKSFGSSLHDGLTKAAAGFAVVGAGLTLYEKSAIDSTENLYKSSKNLGQQIGVSTSEASRLTAAFQRMGVDTDKTSQMFGIFSKKIEESTKNHEQNALASQQLNLEIQKTQLTIKATTDEINKNGDASGALHLKIAQLNTTLAQQKDQLKQSSDGFAKLNISTVDAQGKQKDFESILFEVADKFKAMPDGIEKTALSMDLFGRSGKDMIRVLDQGAQGIKDLEKAADKMGVTLSTTNIDAISKLVQSQKDLAQYQAALKIQIATTTAPVLTAFNKELGTTIGNLLNTKGAVHDVTVGFLSFGGPAAGAAAGALGVAANFAQVAETMKGADGPAGLMLAKLGPIGLGLLFAAGAAGLGYLAYKKLTDATKDYGSATTGTIQSETLVQLGAERVADSQDKVTAALQRHKDAVIAAAPAQDVLIGKQKDLQQAQLNVNDALSKYGANSPQFAAATKDLTDKTNLYNQQLFANWGLQVNVFNAQQDVFKSQSNLADSLASVNRLNSILNNGIDTAATKVANFGQSLSNQQGIIATFNYELDTIAAHFQNTTTVLQSQLPNTTGLFQGLGSTIDRVQGQSGALNKSLQDANYNLQASVVSLQSSVPIAFNVGQQLAVNVHAGFAGTLNLGVIPNTTVAQVNTAGGRGIQNAAVQGAGIGSQLQNSAAAAVQGGAIPGAVANQVIQGGGVGRGHAANQGGSVGATFAGSTGNAIQGGSGYVSGSVSNVVGAAGNNNTGYASSSGGAIGHSFMNGLLSGLQGGFSRVQDFVGSVAHWIAAHKGPISYDAKLLIPHGKAIMQGFQSGLSQEWRNVQSFVGGLGVDMATGIINPKLAVPGSNNGSAANGRSGDLYVQIGEVNNSSDENYILNRISQSWRLEQAGGSPMVGAGF